MLLNSFFFFFGCVVIQVYGFDGRVVNGTDAFYGEFPFTVSLQWRPNSNSNFSHICGGSIISENWILTAAHCAVIAQSPTEFTIKYGIIDITQPTEQIVSVSQITVHKAYDPYTIENDIAVLRLEEPLKLSENVTKIKLPQQDSLLHDSSDVTLVGWGLNASNGDIQNILQKVELKVVSHERCAKIHYFNINESNLCAGSPDGGKGQCSGDSGGPLIYKNEQVGLVSWSVKPCAVYPYPGVYTRVASFRQWISQITGV